MCADTDGDVPQCAACGKSDDAKGGLKKCNGCKVVRYCGVECQRSHRPEHKKECKMFHEKALFRDPPPSEGDCAICFLRLPYGAQYRTYLSCCGKFVCVGCIDQMLTAEELMLCVFCRTPEATTRDEEIKRMKKRMSANDPEAIRMMGCVYAEGKKGIARNHFMATQLFHRAADLGSHQAHSRLAQAYCDGLGVQVDKKKSIYHAEQAAIGGNVFSRVALGEKEHEKGNLKKALQHWMIAARGGHEESWDKVRVLGSALPHLVSREDFNKTEQGYKQYCEEVKSDRREEVVARMIARMGL